MENKALVISYICMSQAQTFSVTGWILLLMGREPLQATKCEHLNFAFMLALNVHRCITHKKFNLYGRKFNLNTLCLRSKVEENIWFVVSWIQLLPAALVPSDDGTASCDALLQQRNLWGWLHKDFIL